MNRGTRILVVGLAVAATAVIHFQAKKLSMPDRPSAVPSEVPSQDLEPTSFLQGRPAPPFALPALDGGSFDLAATRGETVVLNFFATWCGPCRAEMPDLDRFAAAGPARGIRVVAIDVMEPRADVERFARAMGLSMRILLDENGAASGGYGVEAYPTTVLIDPRGIVRSVHVGMIEDFEAWYREAAAIRDPGAPGGNPAPAEAGRPV